MGFNSGFKGLNIFCALAYTNVYTGNMVQLSVNGGDNTKQIVRADRVIIPNTLLKLFILRHACKKLLTRVSMR